MKAIKRVQDGIPEVKGQIKNVDVFRILYSHFVNGLTKEELIERWTPDGGDKSYVARILSTKQGVDTSRRPRVRNVFRNFMIKVGLECPFEKYITSESKRKNKRTRPPTFWD
jgi:hypothetical protein